MTTRAEREAIRILAHLSDYVAADLAVPEFERFQAIKVLHHAVRHLAYPDRDVYPKVRRSKKGDPVVRQRR
jgi:hypothetical protein